MKRILNFSILFIVTFFFYSSSFAQKRKPPIKWGEISEADKALTVCTYDSAATAVVLTAYGKLKMIAGEPASYFIHRRIKVLKQGGEEHANIVIPFYHRDGTERIKYLKAQTFNFKNGQTSFSKLDKKEFYTEKINENWSEIRFSMPAIEVGSILEYSYTLESDAVFSPDPWEFQEELPVLHSEMEFKVYRGRKYLVLLQGPRLMNKYGNSDNYEHWILKDLPAIKEEAFCPNSNIYTEKVRFQLASYIKANGVEEQLMTSWEELSKDLLSNDHFSKMISKRKAAKKLVNTLLNGSEDDQTKMEKLYWYVMDDYIWNGRYRISPSQSFKEIQETKKGTSADMNHFLLALYRAAGLKADPLLMTTKSYGKPSPNYSLLEFFNHVAINVQIEGKDYPIDVSWQSRDPKILPPETLNGVAFVVHKKNYRWIDLLPSKRTRTVTMVQAELGDDPMVQYQLNRNYRDYHAVNARYDLRKADDNAEKFVIDEIMRVGAEIRVESALVSEKSTRADEFKIEAQITDNNLRFDNGDLVYFSPFVDLSPESNPFSNPIRYLPIDFYFPFQEMYVLNLMIPEQFELVELPETVTLKLPNEKGYLKYFVSHNGPSLQLRMDFNILDPFFNPSEYLHLRELYDIMLQKREETLVFRKKTD